MLSRVINHARANVIAYIALGCSLLGLAGGAYAAVKLPANSVGSRQIRNDSITPAKLNHGMIGGTILHWAQVDATGRIVSGSHGVRELAPLNNGGTYGVAWGDTIPTRCTVMATALRSVPSHRVRRIRDGDEGIGRKAHRSHRRHVRHDSEPATQLGFSVAVIC